MRLGRGGRRFVFGGFRVRFVNPGKNGNTHNKIGLVLQNLESQKVFFVTNTGMSKEVNSDTVASRSSNIYCTILENDV